ncbi:hypothetical protein EV361DRAFT_764843, partial [Lentinula raphanica]
VRELEENGERETDNVNGFVEVLKELTAEERETWQADVAPIKSALFKTRRISFKIINSSTLLLPKWREHLVGTKFEGRVLPRDVATRWNSTYDMMAAFLDMKDPVTEFLD